MLTLTLSVLLLAGFVHSTNGSSIVLSSSENFIKPFVTSNMTLICSLLDTAPTNPVLVSSGDVTEPEEKSRDVTTWKNNEEKLGDHTKLCDYVNETTEDVQIVVSMVIYRDGVALATLPEDLPVQLAKEENFTMSGHLTSGAGERARLQLNWPNPTLGDAGTYRCDATSLNSQGHTIVFSKSVKVMEEEISTSNILTQLHMMKETMQKEMEDMQNEMQSKISKLQSQNAAQNKTLDKMKKSENQMQLKITGLEANNSALSQSLESLQAKARVEPDIFFTAILSAEKTYSINDIIVYDKVITNQGSAYNNITGKFTAPVRGFYNFDLHAWAAGGEYASLALRHNGNVVISAYKDGDNWTGTSNSGMIRLSKGDVVDVVCTVSSRLPYHIPYRISNTLSGRLISVI